MASFADLTARLNLNIQNFAQNMQKASALASKFAADLQGKINAGMLEPTKKSKMEFKDVARIVQGIIVSKTFYSSLHAIRNARNAVWEFSNQLEYARMVYTNLFGDANLANEFINVLKDFAAVTPFSFEQAEQAAKRLLAYGIEYKNVMYVMQGVLAAATAQGSDIAVGALSRAIGQIYTKGRLMNEEMRQLAEAGIPAYEILQEKLGLTAEQLRRLGDNAIPADVAINALIEGINERFGSTLENAAKTTQGIISNLVDDATMLFAGIFEPLINKTKNFINNIGSLFASLRKTFELKGIGGVFEQLIPPSLQPAIKQLIANIKILWDIIKSGLNSALKILRVLLKNLLNVINAILPIILSVAGAIGTVVKAIAENKRLMQTLITVILGAAGAWAIYRLQALLATVTITVIKGMVKAIEGLIKALNFLIAHPIWLLLAAGVGLFLALTGASERFRKSLSDLFKGFYSMGGVDVDKLLLPEINEQTNALDKFNKALSGTSDAIEDASKASSNAAKNLMSFDEVFTIDTSSGDSTDEVDSFIPDFAELGGLDFSNVEISMPPVDEIATNFVNNLSEAFGSSENILGAAIGSILGGALGLLMGGPLGAKIGLLLGGLAGWFWDEFAAQLGLTDAGKIAIPIATGLGAAIGFVAGGPGGALIGGGIGLLVGWFIDDIAKALETGDWSVVAIKGGMGLGAAIGLIVGGPGGALIGGGIGLLVGWFIDNIAKALETGDWSNVTIAGGMGLGAAIGMIVGGPGGALIGGGIGLLVGWFIDNIAKALETGDWSTVAIAGGMGLGAAIGMIVGGPGGALIGGGIGLLVGWFIDNIAKALETGDWSVVAIAGGAGIGAAIGMIIGGPGGALIGGGIGLLVGWLVDNIVKALEAGDWSTVAMAGGTGLGAAIGMIIGGPVGALIGGTIGALVGWLLGLIIENWDSIVAWFDEAAKKIGDFFQGIWDTISEKVRGAWDTITEVFQGIWATIKEKVSGAWNTVTEFFQNIWDTIKEKVSGAWNTITEGFQGIWNTIKEKVSGAWNTITEVFQGIWNTIKEKVSGAWDTITEVFQGIWNTIKEKVSGAWDTVIEFFQNIWDTISEKVSGAWDTVTEFFQNIWGTIKEKVSGAWDTVTEFFQNIWDTIKEKVSGAWDSVSEAFSGIYDTISEKISGMYSSVKDGIKNIYSAFKDWIKDMWDNIFNKFFGWIDDAINKLKNFFGLNSKAQNTNIPTRDSTTVTSVTTGHATGGIFNREHIARIAEGNKAEAIIPLENQNAMQPFADAIANGVAAALLPVLSSMNNRELLQPVYVGTLIADDRGLKELERKLQIIRLSENSRRGS